MMGLRPHHGMFVIVAMLLAASPALTLAKTPLGKNIARGCAYELSSKPNYSLCTNPTDLADLTDGQTTEGSIWMNPGTVGWNQRKPVAITVDLGKVQSIGAVALRGAAGRAGVGWPNTITAMVSQDGKTYHLLAELTAAGGPLPPPYDGRTATAHRFVAEDLNGRGRYVRFFLVPSGRLVFTDEIEVYSNPDADKSPVDNGPIATLEMLNAPQRLTALGLQRRLHRDLTTVQGTLPSKLKASTAGEIARIRKAIVQLPSFSKSLKLNRGYPLNSLHQRIFNLYAQSLHARGLEPQTFWKTHRYDPLDPFDVPRGTQSRINLTVLPGEHRADVINITNTEDQPCVMTVRFEGLPGGATPDYVEISEVLFTDSPEWKTIHTVLMPVQKTDGSYRVVVTSGMTTQLWISFNPSLENAGEYDGTLIFESSTTSQTHTVPIHLVIAPVALVPSTFGWQMWDYATEAGRDLTKQNAGAAIADMKARGVNVPWATVKTAPMPKPSDFNKAGQLIKPLNFAAFDRFVKTWPNAQRYMIFLNASKSKAFGVKAGTDRFNLVVGSWISAWADHLRKRGIADGQVTLLLVDEPNTPAEWLATLHWGQAIKAATDAFDIFVDPVEPHPPIVENSAEALAYCDIISPTWSQYERSKKTVKAFYQQIVNNPDKELWLYSCGGPVLQFNPAYFRLQSWRSFSIGGTGTGFWSYGDAGTKDAWNPYISNGIGFAPVYLAPDSVTSTKHWEAAREGVQDVAMFEQLAATATSLNVKKLASKPIDRAIAKEPYFFEFPDFVAVHRWADTARDRAVKALIVEQQK